MGQHYDGNYGKPSDCSDSKYGEMMVKLIEPYYANNANKLHRIVADIVNRKFSVAQKDMDFYCSAANNVIAEIIHSKKYSPDSGDFEGYLYRSLVFAFIDEIKKENRQKRKNIKYIADENGNDVVKVFIHDVPLDALIGEANTDGLTYGDVIESDFDTEAEVYNLLGQNCSDEMGKYLDSLSGLSRKVAEEIMKGSKPYEIRQDLGLTEKQYQVAWQEISSYEKKRILYNVVYRDNSEVEDMARVKAKKEKEVVIDEKTARKIIGSDDAKEKYKNTSYSIEEISRQMREGSIRDDHTLQRHSGQWANFAKSELVADILRGKSLTQIIISEEYRGEYRIQWLIDGKQRCTVLDNYLHDGFRISKTLKQPYIRYQVQKVDENGNNIFDDDGFPEIEWKVTDIRNKKFSQLPDKLQFFFKSRQIPILYNMNCTKDEIISDISRFNRGKPMNKSQNGWLNIDEGFGIMVKKIAELEFFQPTFEGTSYTAATAKSGNDFRVIIEGIMTCNYINDFNDYDKMCEFLNENASDNDFTDFYQMIERLTPLCKPETKQLFAAKNSAVWFGLFSRFSELELNNDALFADFMKAFAESLHSKEVNGQSFDELDTKGSKERNKVVAKVNFLERLMLDFIAEKTGTTINTYDYNDCGNDDYIKNDCGEIHNDDVNEEASNEITEETLADNAKEMSVNNIVEESDNEESSSEINVGEKETDSAEIHDHSLIERLKAIHKETKDDFYMDSENKDDENLPASDNDISDINNDAVSINDSNDDINTDPVSAKKEDGAVTRPLSSTQKLIDFIVANVNPEEGYDEKDVEYDEERLKLYIEDSGVSKYNKLFGVGNHMALLAILAYSTSQNYDEYFTGWLKSFERVNTNYMIDDQRNFYYHMKRNFDRYVDLKKNKVA